MSRRKFICMDCGIDTGRIHEHYMLWDDIWVRAHATPYGMLCVGCFETRIGRKLKASDFPPSYINHPRTAPQSSRLRSRMETR